MAIGRDFKILATSKDDKGKVIATTMYLVDALILVRAWPRRGVQIKYAGRLVWDEPREEFSAFDDRDRAEEVIRQRMTRHRRESYDSVYGAGSYDKRIAETEKRDQQTDREIENGSRT